MLKVESLFEYVSSKKPSIISSRNSSTHGTNGAGLSGHGLSAHGLPTNADSSYHSLDKSVGGGRMFHTSRKVDALDKDGSEKSQEVLSQQGGLKKTSSSGSFSSVLLQLSSIPLHVRGRAEAWETPRNQIKLQQKIGEGETGVVFKCRWRGLDCAAKILSLNSKTSVASDEPLLILNEFMAGGSLEDRFAAMYKHLGHPWRPSRTQGMKWIKDLTRAVTFLHHCHTPIIHRDLKPANLLLSDEDHLKVADFGLCKTLLKVNEDGKPYVMTGKTGTMRYMAPEVVRSEPHYDEKVDIYSMAMIFWYILVGARPFEGVQPELVAELASSRGMRPSMESLHFPEMEALIEKMWADLPRDRPGSSEILEKLMQMDSGADEEAEEKRKSVKCSLKCQCVVM